MSEDKSVTVDKLKAAKDDNEYKDLFAKVTDPVELLKAIADFDQRFGGGVDPYYSDLYRVMFEQVARVIDMHKGTTLWVILQNDSPLMVIERGTQEEMRSFCEALESRVKAKIRRQTGQEAGMLFIHCRNLPRYSSVSEVPVL